MASKEPSTVEELERLRKPALEQFLKSRNVRNLSKLNKPQLLNLARLYVAQPVLRVPQVPQVQIKWDSDEIRWTDILKSKPSIPQSFSITTITEFLATIDVGLGDDDEDYEGGVNIGTKKPVVKGRQMYMSGKIGFAEWAILQDGTLLLRANCSASLKNKLCRYPKLAVLKSGEITCSDCTCEAKSDGRCTHVGCLLYMVEDVSMDVQPRVVPPSTSITQYWGKGKTHGNDPKPIYSDQYGKKRKTDRYHSFDPRTEVPTTSAKEQNEAFLRDLQMTGEESMFEDILSFEYQDYPLSNERRMTLVMLCQDYKENLGVQAANLADGMSNQFSYHIAGTLGQSNDKMWHQVRACRITASRFKEFSANPKNIALHLWDKPQDLSHVPSIKWGRKHENDAKSAYCAHYGHVKDAGLFVSKSRPLFGASPDGLIDGGGLLEIKCPFVLRDKNLKDIKENGTFYTFTDGKLTLRRTHAYFFQVQLQMFVTGERFTDFFI